MYCRIPERAAERIVLNPHSCPHVPTDLQEMVAYNRHQAARSDWANSSYQRRRSHWDQERAQRMTHDPDEALLTDSDAELEDALYPLGSATRTTGHRRHSSVYEASYDFRLPMRRSFEQISQHTIDPLGRRPLMALRGFPITGTPEERMRMRSNASKRPRPALWGRRHSSTNELHPFWHWRLRNEYRQLGREDQWRVERGLFMLDFRRARQFNTLFTRRNSL